MPKLDIEKARGLMKARKLSKYRIAKETGMTTPSVDYWFITGTARAIEPVAKVLGVDPRDITLWGNEE